jgi:hypothetical protein
MKMGIMKIVTKACLGELTPEHRSVYAWRTHCGAVKLFVVVDCAQALVRGCDDEPHALSGAAWCRLC